MPVGVNHFDRLKEDVLKWRPANAERTAWAQLFLSLLTQASALAAFPSYNVVLGFWGLYTIFTRSLQATQVYLGLLCLTILLDIIFCSIWGSNDSGVFDGSTTTFCLTMLIFNMIAKAVGVYTFLRFYKELEAGSLRPHDVPSLKRGSGRGSGAAYDKAPMLSGEERGPVGSPSGSIFSASSEASFAISPKGPEKLDGSTIPHSPPSTPPE